MYLGIVPAVLFLESLVIRPSFTAVAVESVKFGILAGFAVAVYLQSVEATIGLLGCFIAIDLVVDAFLLENVPIWLQRVTLFDPVILFTGIRVFLIRDKELLLRRYRLITATRALCVISLLLFTVILCKYIVADQITDSYFCAIGFELDWIKLLEIVRPLPARCPDALSKHVHGNFSYAETSAVCSLTHLYDCTQEKPRIPTLLELLLANSVYLLLTAAPIISLLICWNENGIIRKNY